jgi:hypothetical protein
MRGVVPAHVAAFMTAVSLGGALGTRISPALHLRTLSPGRPTTRLRTPGLNVVGGIHICYLK